MKSLTICVALLAVCVSVTADEKKQQAAKPKPVAFESTHADVSYGPDKMNVVDFWQAEGEGPRPLLVYIHGGGWIGGDKKRSQRDVQPFLDKGISYASVNYRL
ncbi:MAG: alpha/beta hydrolase, partial [Fuerstiella sp.]